MVDENVMKVDLKVGKIGWDNENPIVPIVLIDKVTRNVFGVEVGNVVKVFKSSGDVEVSSFAIVQVQFKELINKNVATLNTELNKKLEMKVGDVVSISKEVTETQAETFRTEVSSRFPF